MNISELCVRRPVFATVLSLLILLLGLVGLDRLTLREYPAVLQPVINVFTSYTGATAEVVESEITTPIEESMAGLEGIDYMNSVSRAGESYINIAFKQDRDIEAAAADVRDRLDRVRFVLPEDIAAPIIWKQEADSTPFMWISVVSNTINVRELTELAKDLVQDRLLVISGVGQIVLWASQDFAMRVWLDRTALAAYGLTVQDVEQAIRRQNVDIPSGRIESATTELTILSRTSLQQPDEFARIVIANHDGYLVRLGDVARVELGGNEVRTSARINGANNLVLGIRLQSIANPLEVGKQVRAELENIRQLLPDGVALDIVEDSTYPIQRSIDNVYTTFVEALLLVVLVVFVFLRSPRATLIPLVTIPISIIGVSALMWWWGFSLNTLTLLAMLLAIGIVVDDAIVVLENIHRHIENGLPPREAAIKGSKEILFAVVAMTVTLAAVYAPLGFSEGVTGKLFVEFALTLAGAVIISGFVALTLTPMMCGRLLKRQVHDAAKVGLAHRLGELSAAIDKKIFDLNYAYEQLIRRLSLRPLRQLVVLALVVVLAVLLTRNLPTELAPFEDQGKISVFAIAPEGTNVAYGEKYTAELVKKIRSIPEVARVFAYYGNPTVNQHTINIQLEDWDARDRSQFEVHQDIKALLAETTGMIFISMDWPPLGQFARQRPVDILLQSSMSYQQLAAVAQKVMAQLADNPELSGLNLDLTLNKPQLDVQLDRDKLADTGLDVSVVGRTLETLFGGRDVTEFQRGVRKYDVIVQMQPDDRRDPGDIGEVYLRNEAGELILLEDVVDISETIVPRQLNHFNKLRAANITANPGEGYTLGEALASAVAEIEAMGLEGISLEFGGQSREFLESSQQVYFTAVLSLVFIYLVLAAQFESFRDPFIILLSVPFAVLGAALVLNLTGKSFSIYSQIGMITLVGLITKHGIMMVDTANRLRLDGVGKFEAIIEACSQRFRPIIMTTAAMVLGSLPLALAAGAGAESRSQIGWVIVGGLVGGTILTLLVTPSLYLLLSKPKLAQSP